MSQWRTSASPTGARRAASPALGPDQDDTTRCHAHRVLRWCGTRHVHLDSLHILWRDPVIDVLRIHRLGRLANPHTPGARQSHAIDIDGWSAAWIARPVRILGEQAAHGQLFAFLPQARDLTEDVRS